MFAECRKNAVPSTYLLPTTTLSYRSLTFRYEVLSREVFAGRMQYKYVAVGFGKRIVALQSSAFQHFLIVLRAASMTDPAIPASIRLNMIQSRKAQAKSYLQNF